MRKLHLLAAAAALLAAAPALPQDGPKLTIGGTTYTKWLWSTQRDEGSLYNFTTVPGEGWGNNGQGTEIELFVNGRLSRQVELRSRIHSRFSQNFWTNFGGFGGRAPEIDDAGQIDLGTCTDGDCGEFDPRSNQYVKLRGVTLILTPGYRWLDSATIGASDLGMFDPFVIGRIRYIDRDNAQALLFQGSALGRALTYDAIRISLPRLWAGPGFSTGDWHSTDAAYGMQLKYAHGQRFDAALIGEYVNDREIDADDLQIDDGFRMTPRFRNGVGGLRAGVHLPMADVRAAAYYSWAKVERSVGDSVGFVGFQPVPYGRRDDVSVIADVVFNDPLGVGLSLNLQGFSIGKDYVSLMAARRESDVLLTEGHDSTWAFPGPSNAKFGVFGGRGNDTVIGYGGWGGNAQQVPTINVDNEFSDFDEPMAETAIGWQGVTLNPVFSRGPLEVSGEYTFITYDTNWQAWGDPSKPIGTTPYPSNEGPVGLGSFRAAYAPFQDKQTQIAVVRAKYTLEAMGGIDLFGKAKYIRETDKRMDDARFLPYEADGVTEREYSPGNSTADIFGNPPDLLTPQWKPFTSLADDDRELDYFSFNVGAGYQLSDSLYVSLAYAKYLASLVDGNTAFQAYNLHEMASGDHDKNQFILKGKYVLAGVEFGLEGQYSFGTFEPDFGSGFVPQAADAAQAEQTGVAVGSPGFAGRFTGWNSLLEREFDEYRLKAFMKAQF